ILLPLPSDMSKSFGAAWRRPPPSPGACCAPLVVRAVLLMRRAGCYVPHPTISCSAARAAARGKRFLNCLFARQPAVLLQRILPRSAATLWLRRRRFRRRWATGEPRLDLGLVPHSRVWADQCPAGKAAIPIQLFSVTRFWTMLRARKSTNRSFLPT